MSRIIITACSLLLFGCGLGRREQNQDLVNKLRSLGTQADPLVTAPSVDGQTPMVVNLTFYACVPTGVTATVVPFRDIDDESGLYTNIETDQLKILDGTEQYIPYNDLQLFSVKAQATVPSHGATPVGRTGQAAASASDGFQAKYGFEITAGDGDEKVTGSFLVVPAGSPELAWTNPGIDITQPADGAALPIKSDIDMEAVTQDLNGEDIILGWFVTDGAVANRRASSTTWRATDAGAQTVLVTAHGAQSRGFSLKAIKVSTEEN
jgi:hypothetical protein